MDYDELAALRQHSAAWRLLRADNAPLVLEFLGKVFVDDNVRAVPFTVLVDRLDDELYALNERLGESTFPRSAREYLDAWAAPEAGWLRKYYPPSSDEAHLDATPALEKAVAFARSLPQRAFVGTESRLNTAFDLLRQIAYGAEADRDVRLVALQARRDEVDAQIEALRRGDVEVMEPAALQDRYQQFSATAFGLLSDLREVEDSIRRLDRELRERVAGWDGSKGELLEEVLGGRDAISDSNTGVSFHAFYDFLLSRARQEEFSDLLARVCRLEAIGEVDPRIRRIHHDWLDAGERTQATVRLLSEQLRRFLDDRTWLENRRVMEVLRSIELHALAIRDGSARAPGSELDATSPTITLPFERPLYAPQPPLTLDSSEAELAEEIDVEALFTQTYVDSARLTDQVRRALNQRAQVGLRHLLETTPLQQGLAELLGYFSLEDNSFEPIFDPDVREQVRWSEPDGRRRVADVPRLTFARRTTDSVGAR